MPLNIIKNHKISRFIISGLCAVAAEYTSFLLLQDSLPLVLAHSFSFSAGLVVSFTLNRIWVFQATHGQKRQQFVRYAAIALINLALSNLLIRLLVDTHISLLFAKLIVMAAVASWNFVIFGHLVFPQKPNSSASTK